MCYVLIGYWSTPEEDLYRVTHLEETYGIDAFAMPFNKFDPYQKDFARWVNNKILHGACTWEEYMEGKKNKEW